MLQITVKINAAKNSFGFKLKCREIYSYCVNLYVKLTCFGNITYIFEMIPTKFFDCFANKMEATITKSVSGINICLQSCHFPQFLKIALSHHATSFVNIKQSKESFGHFTNQTHWNVSCNRK